MKKIIVHIFILTWFSVPVFAQQAKKIEALKVEYITRKLDLSPGEAERFWPLYRSYQKEMQQILLERRHERQEQKMSGTAVDELNYESRILEVRKRYKKEFAEAISAQKAQRLFLAEREFREKLIRQLGEKHNNDR